MGFVGLLTLAFIILKIIHAIDWSWWVVLSPLLASVGLALVLSIIGVLAGLRALGKAH